MDAGRAISFTLQIALSASSDGLLYPLNVLTLFGSRRMPRTFLRPGRQRYHDACQSGSKLGELAKTQKQLKQTYGLTLEQLADGETVIIALQVLDYISDGVHGGQNSRFITSPTQDKTGFHSRYSKMLFSVNHIQFC